MRFLADENFPGDAVNALRSDGHDVAWIRTLAPGISDEEVLRRAETDERVLLTFDKDFGELAYQRRLPASCGVVLVRLPMHDPVASMKRLVQVLGARSDWAGKFWVIDDRRVRMRPLPSHTDE